MEWHSNFLQTTILSERSFSYSPISFIFSYSKLSPDHASIQSVAALFLEYPIPLEWISKNRTKEEGIFWLYSAIKTCKKTIRTTLYFQWEKNVKI